MNIDLKQIRFLFLAFSLTLVWADCNFFVHTHYNSNISSHRECADLANHVEQSHSENFQDESFISNSNTSSNNQLDTELLPDLSLLSNIDCISSIWQPPKIS